MFGMARWEHQVELGDLWAAFDDRSMTVTEVAAEAHERLSAVNLSCQEWDDALEEMGDLSRSGMDHFENEEWFSVIMDEIWNLADEYRIWIEVMAVPA